MSIFVNADDTFDISFVTAKSKDGTELCETTVDKLKEMNEGTLDDATIEEHRCTFRYPSFEDNITISDNAIEFSSGQMKFNPNRAEKNKMVALMKKWSFKDKKGKPVPLTEKNIGLLDGEIATIITYLLNQNL